MTHSPSPTPKDPSAAFNQATGRTSPRQRAADSPRITLRLTDEEREQLEKLAAGQSISAYVRSCMFGKDASPRKIKLREPVKDQEALAQVLGLLGQSRLANNLNQIAHGVNMGTLPLDEHVEQEIKEACARIAWIRVKLIEALGLKDGSSQ